MTLEDKLAELNAFKKSYIDAINALTQATQFDSAQPEVIAKLMKDLLRTEEELHDAVRETLQNRPMTCMR